MTKPDPIPVSSILRDPRLTQGASVVPETPKGAEKIASWEDRNEVRKLTRQLGLSQLKEMEHANGKPFDSAYLAQVCRAAALDVGLRVLGGEFEVKDSKQAADVVKALVEVARLESGQATAITSTASVDDVMRQMMDLKERVQARIRSEVDPPKAIDAKATDA